MLWKWPEGTLKKTAEVLLKFQRQICHHIFEDIQGSAAFPRPFKSAPKTVMSGNTS